MFWPAIIGILGHIRREMRIKALSIEKRRAHKVSDQEIVEQLMFDARHQRIAWAFETDPDIAFSAIEIDGDA